MNEKKAYKLKTASDELIKLYALMGEALCAVQLIEDALSHAIAMKKDISHPSKVSKTEADKLLEKYRKYTLGRAITIVKKAELFGEELRQRLDEIKQDRNWLIHKSMYESLDSSPDKMSFEHCKDTLYARVKTITYKANDIQHLISEDLIRFSEEIGLDISRVRQVIGKYYR